MLYGSDNPLGSCRASQFTQPHKEKWVLLYFELQVFHRLEYKAKRKRRGMS